MKSTAVQPPALARLIKVLCTECCRATRWPAWGHVQTKTIAGCCLVRPIVGVTTSCYALSSASLPHDLGRLLLTQTGGGW